MNLKQIRTALIIVGPLLGLVVFALAQHLGLAAGAAATAGITLWVGLWWIFEPVPLPATSLIPFAAFPLAGVLPNKVIAQAYGHWLILLLLGGFILSTAMEKSGVHRRIAIGMIRGVGGTSPARLILGVMLATGLLSGWISNTATVLMMLPVAIALCGELPGPKSVRSLMLGLAYAASIGGIATPIGTPPNVVLMGIYEETTGKSIGFLDWMVLGGPLAAVFLVVAWFVLTRGLEKHPNEDGLDRLPRLGAVTPYEKRVLFVFAFTALAWIFRAQPFGGWSGLLGIATVGDDTVALAAAALLFVVPNGEGKGEKLFGLGNGTQDSLGPAFVVRRWDCPSESVWRIWPLQGHRRILGRGYRTALGPHDRLDLSVRHLPDRDDQQYRHHHFAHAHFGGDRPGRPNGTFVAHDSSGAQRQLCFHVARSHRAQRHCLGLRKDYHPGNGTHGLLDEPLGRADRHHRLFDFSAFRLIPKRFFGTLVR